MGLSLVARSRRDLAALFMHGDPDCPSSRNRGSDGRSALHQTSKELEKASYRRLRVAARGWRQDRPVRREGADIRHSSATSRACSTAVTWRSAGKRMAQRQSKEVRGRLRHQDLEGRSGPLLRSWLGQRRGRVPRWPASSSRSLSVVLEAQDALCRAARRSHWPMAHRARGSTLAEGLSTTACACAAWSQALLVGLLGLRAFVTPPTTDHHGMFDETSLQ